MLLFINNIEKTVGIYGTRAPSVFILQQKLQIRTDTDSIINDITNLDNDLPLNTKTTVKVQAKGIYLKVCFNDETIIGKTIITRFQLAQGDAFLIEGHHDSSNAVVSDLFFYESYEWTIQANNLPTNLSTNPPS